MSYNVLYSPPYFSAMMHKCCIGTLDVSRLMCSTRLITDGCFNNIVDKNISSPCSFRPIWASIGALNYMKIATLLHKKTVFNNVHLQQQKVQ